MARSLSTKVSIVVRNRDIDMWLGFRGLIYNHYVHTKWGLKEAYTAFL